MVKTEVVLVVNKAGAVFNSSGGSMENVGSSGDSELLPEGGTVVSMGGGAEVSGTVSVTGGTEVSGTVSSDGGVVSEVGSLEASSISSAETENGRV